MGIIGREIHDRLSWKLDALRRQEGRDCEDEGEPPTWHLRALEAHPELEWDTLPRWEIGEQPWPSWARSSMGLHLGAALGEKRGWRLRLIVQAPQTDGLLVGRLSAVQVKPPFGCLVLRGDCASSSEALPELIERLLAAAARWVPEEVDQNNKPAAAQIDWEAWHGATLQRLKEIKR